MWSHRFFSAALPLVVLLSSGALAQGPACDPLGPRKQCGELPLPPLPVAACLPGAAVPPAWSPAPPLSLLLRTWLTALERSPPTGNAATSSESCAELGCCWSVEPLALEAWQPDVFLPACFYANAGPSTYSVVNATADDLVEAGFLGAATRCAPLRLLLGVAATGVAAAVLPFCCAPARQQP